MTPNQGLEGVVIIGNPKGAVRELLDAAMFARSVLEELGGLELSERIAQQKLDAALERIVREVQG